MSNKNKVGNNEGKETAHIVHNNWISWPVHGTLPQSPFKKGKEV